jgi:integrase
MSTDLLPVLRPPRAAWNKGRIIGQKRPLQPKHVWLIRVRLEMADNRRNLALFNMAVDNKLRGCDLVCLRVRDVFEAGRIKERASMTQSKTGKPVKFEITETTWQSLDRWIADPEMFGVDFLWPSRLHGSPHLSTRQDARILRGWVTLIGLEPSAYGTHSMRRIKVAQIYKKTGNLRAVQLPLGHTKMDSTVRYLGVDIEDTLTLSRGLTSSQQPTGADRAGRPDAAVRPKCVSLHRDPSKAPFAAPAKQADCWRPSTRTKFPVIPPQISRSSAFKIVDTA